MVVFLTALLLQGKSKSPIGFFNIPLKTIGLHMKVKKSYKNPFCFLYRRCKIPIGPLGHPIKPSEHHLGLNNFYATIRTPIKSTGHTIKPTKHPIGINYALYMIIMRPKNTMRYPIKLSYDGYTPQNDKKILYWIMIMYIGERF